MYIQKTFPCLLLLYKLVFVFHVCLEWRLLTKYLSHPNSDGIICFFFYLDNTKYIITCKILFSFQRIGPLGRCFLQVEMSVCVFVRLSVCLSVCLSVSSLLRYRLTVFLPPLPKVGCPICLEIWNPWGKVMERNGLRY